RTSPRPRSPPRPGVPCPPSLPSPRRQSSRAAMVAGPAGEYRFARGEETAVIQAGRSWLPGRRGKDSSPGSSPPAGASSSSTSSRSTPTARARRRPIEPEARAFAAVLVKSVKALGDAVRGLRDLRHREALIAHCTEINRLENEGDQLLRRAVARLFHDSKDPIHVIKWKEIYDNLENAIDRCED